MSTKNLKIRKEKSRIPPDRQAIGYPSVVFMKTYIRFGKLPPDGKSKIYERGSGEIIGEEEGISVFEYIEGRGIVVPNNKDAIDDFFKLTKSYWKPNYLVTGDELGTGSDQEPIITNVQILKENFFKI